MKKLFTQIRNEWRSNLWLMAEMLIVSVVMWYIADSLYYTTETYNIPRGFNIDHTYKIGFDKLTDKSPDFIADQSEEDQIADIQEFMDRIRRRPEVMAVSLSMNSHPYNGSNSSCSLTYDTLETRGYVVHRRATPEFPIVFQYHGTQGETPEKLAQLLNDNNGGMLVSDNLFKRYGRSITSLVGESLLWDGDSASAIQILAALEPVKYADFHRWATQSILKKLNPALYNWASELCVRVHADKDVDFAENLLADSEKHFRVGNLYITSVTPFSKIRESFQRGFTNDLRNSITGMIFLMVNIFLGLLGTFWFRTQQRTSEIAIRRVNGATRRSIFRRLIGEGLLLLTIVTPVAAIIDINLALTEIVSWLEWPRMIVSVIAVYIIMALMIVGGIYFPARKAMNTDPAEALHDE